MVTLTNRDMPLQLYVNWTYLMPAIPVVATNANQTNPCAKCHVQSTLLSELLVPVTHHRKAFQLSSSAFPVSLK